MLRKDYHLSDEELLLASDGELLPGHEGQVLAHLADCPACIARMKRMEEATANLVRAYHADRGPYLPPIAGSRATLKAEMAAFSSGSARAGWRDRVAHWFVGPRWAYVVGMILVAALGTRLLFRQMEPGDLRTPAAQSDAGPLLPDPELTPGMARLISASQACTAGPSDQMATIPMAVRKAVFHEYGMDRSESRHFEVDHLITPELGGTDDIRNLWPEPYSSTEWNAYVKDELEDHLRHLVCDGKLDLATAQRDIATDWIAAYRKYFHTDKPLTNASRLAWNERDPAD